VPEPARQEDAGKPPRLAVGLIRGVRGLRGQLRVELLTDRPEDRFTVGARLYLEGTPETLTVTAASPVADGPGWWLQFQGVTGREAAEALMGRYLEIDTPAEPPEAGRWFWHELQGLAVRSAAGEELGTITDIYRAGGAEVFVVRGARGELDVPGVRGIVLDLAPARGEMIVDLDALALDARAVEDDDYVRPRDRRPRKQPKAGKGGTRPTPRQPDASPGMADPGASPGMADPGTGTGVSATPPAANSLD
jgi:16S rRNA processing protein RimM